MKRFVSGALLAVLFVAVAVFSPARQKSEPEHKLIEFHMALLKRGPKWTGDATAHARTTETEQRQYAALLMESGKAVIAGRLTDDGEIRGIYILRAKSAEEAKAWAEASPAVKAGYIIVEMHPWWSEDVMKKTSTPDKMTTAHLGFLKRGAKWTPEKTPATAELQKAHLANITGWLR